jgi:peptidoglycan/LPS O-acetylase OafA/YrhL
MPQLDGIRALAVFAVMLHHFLPFTPFPLRDFVDLGMLGVRLFFVLSGFLITGILLNCRRAIDRDVEGASLAVRHFYIRRFLRIFPVYYLTLAVMALLNVPSVRATLVWHVSYLSNVRFAVIGTFENPLAHLWSLAVEEQFYLIWPWLIIFAPRRHLHGILLATIAVAPVFRLLVYLSGGNDIIAETLLFGCMDSLGLGALLAYYGSAPAYAASQRRLRAFSSRGGVLTLLVLGALYSIGTWKAAAAPMLLLAVSLVFAWVVHGAARGFRGPVGRLLEAGAVVYVGKISYGIYLVHNFMPVLAPRLLPKFGLAYPDPSETGRRFLTLAACTLVVAALSWHLFEAPINRLKKYFPYSPATQPADQR